MKNMSRDLEEAGRFDMAVIAGAICFIKCISRVELSGHHISLSYALAL